MSVKNRIIKEAEKRLEFLVEDLSIQDLDRVVKYWMEKYGRERVHKILDIIADEKQRRYRANH